MIKHFTKYIYIIHAMIFYYAWPGQRQLPRSLQHHYLSHAIDILL